MGANDLMTFLRGMAEWTAAAVKANLQISSANLKRKSQEFFGMSIKIELSHVTLLVHSLENSLKMIPDELYRKWALNPLCG